MTKHIMHWQVDAYEIPDDDGGPILSKEDAKQVDKWAETVIAELERRAKSELGKSAVQLELES